MTNHAVEELVGVYDADGGVRGEVTYVVGHLLGRLECALCDITHGPLRRKRAFDDLRARLGVPFALVHRNEQEPVIAAVTGDALPCVVARVGTAWRIVIDRDTLTTCAGDVDAFARALDSALTRGSGGGRDAGEGGE
ncbi:MAG TPA: hypothetical protein VFZ83_11745 [Acidimicrobiia bacterium]|nr:hypothetical protein [Acidimicrobiia bacterium]